MPKTESATHRRSGNSLCPTWSLRRHRHPHRSGPPKPSACSPRLLPPTPKPNPGSAPSCSSTRRRQRRLLQQRRPLPPARRAVGRAVEELRPSAPDRSKYSARLWELAHPQPPNGPKQAFSTGRIRTMSMIVAMQNFIPNPRAASPRGRYPPLRPPNRKSMPPHGVLASRPQPMPQRMTRSQPLPLTRKKLSQKMLPARRQRRLRIPAPASPLPPTALPPRKNRGGHIPPCSILSPTWECISLCQRTPL